MQISDIHSGKFSHSPKKGGMAPGCGRGLDSGKKPGDDGIRAGWDILSIITAREAGLGPLLLSPSLTLLVHPRRSGWGHGKMCLQTMRDLIWLARIWGPLGSLAGEVAATVKGSEAGEGGAPIHAKVK